MSRIELLARQESLYRWILDPVNHTNPNWKKVIAYWLRLTAMILNIDLIPNNTLMNMNTEPKHEPIVEELGTPPSVMDMEVEYEIVEP